MLQMKRECSSKTRVSDKTRLWQKNKRVGQKNTLVVKERMCGKRKCVWQKNACEAKASAHGRTRRERGAKSRGGLILR